MHEVDSLDVSFYDTQINVCVAVVFFKLCSIECGTASCHALNQIKNLCLSLSAPSPFIEEPHSKLSKRPFKVFTNITSML